MSHRSGETCGLILLTPTRSYAPPGADSTSGAQVININFSKWATDGVNTVVGSGQGPVTCSGTSWNNLIQAGARADLVDSVGNATAVGIDFANDGYWNGSSPLVPVNDYLFVNSGAAGVIKTNSFTFSGLVAGESYDISFLGHGDNNTQDTMYTIGKTSKTIDPVDVAANAWVYGENYVTFSNIVADAGGEITGTYQNVSAQHAGVGGIQIATGLTVTEPTAPFMAMASNAIGAGEITVSAGNLDVAKSYELQSALTLENPIVWTTLVSTSGVFSADWTLPLTETSRFFQVKEKIP